MDLYSWWKLSALEVQHETYNLGENIIGKDHSIMQLTRDASVNGFTDKPQQRLTALKTISTARMIQRSSHILKNITVIKIFMLFEVVLPATVCIRGSRQRLETVLHTCAENYCRPERHGTYDTKRHGSSDL